MVIRLARRNRIRITLGIPIPPIMTGTGTPLVLHRLQRITLATPQRLIVTGMGKRKGHPLLLLTTSAIVIRSSEVTTAIQQSGRGKK